MFHKIKKKILDLNIIKDSLFMNLVYIFYTFIRFLISSRFNFYAPIKMKPTKKSDTLVILGSGNTLNELNEKQLKYISECDIAGLSYSIFHPFKQRYFFFESPRSYENETIEVFRQKLLPRVESLYKNKDIENLIWKNSEENFFKKFINHKNYKNIIVCHILTDNKLTMIRLLKFMECLKLNKYFLLQKRASVFSLVQFAKLMGYTKVIFSGVDLLNNKYFIEDEIYKKHGLPNPSTIDIASRISKYGNNLSSSIHNTDDSNLGLPTSKALSYLFEEYNDIKFLVTSKNTELLKYIQLWKI